MKKTFKSKIDLLLLIPILAILLSVEIFMIVNFILIGIIAAAIPVIFIAYLWIATVYVVTDDHRLRVRSGFLFDREIYIKSIKKLKPAKGRIASPALSFDRLEIFYNRYGRVVVSPINKQGFINELKEVNPRIRVEEGNNESLYHSVEQRIENVVHFRHTGKTDQSIEKHNGLMI